MTYSVYGKNTNDYLLQTTNAFLIQVKHCQWYVQAQRTGTSKRVEGLDIALSEWAYNGETLCRRDRFVMGTTNPPERLGLTNEMVLTHLSIFPGACPHTDMSLCGPLWLVYASPCYVSTSGFAKIKPVYAMNPVLVTDSDYTVRSRASYSGKRLLDWVFENEGTTPLQDPEGSLQHAEGGATVVIRNPEPLQLGYLEAKLTVHDYLESDLPKSWDLTYWSAVRTLEIERGFTNRLDGRITGVVTNLAQLTQDLPDLLSLTTRTYVRDYRPYPGTLRSVAYISGSHVLDKGSQEYSSAQRAIEAKRRQLATSLNQRAALRRTLSWCAVAVAILLVAFLVTRERARRLRTHLVDGAGG